MIPKNKNNKSLWIPKGITLRKQIIVIYKREVKVVNYKYNYWGKEINVKYYT